MSYGGFYWYHAVGSNRNKDEFSLHNCHTDASIEYQDILNIVDACNNFDLNSMQLILCPAVFKLCKATGFYDGNDSVFYTLMFLEFCQNNIADKRTDKIFLTPVEKRVRHIIPHATTILENVERSTLNFFLRRIKDQRLLTEEEKQTIQYIE